MIVNWTTSRIYISMNILGQVIKVLNNARIFVQKADRERKGAKNQPETRSREQAQAENGKYVFAIQIFE